MEEIKAKKTIVKTKRTQDSKNAGSASKKTVQKKSASIAAPEEIKVPKETNTSNEIDDTVETVEILYKDEKTDTLAEGTLAATEKGDLPSAANATDLPCNSAFQQKPSTELDVDPDLGVETEKEEIEMIPKKKILFVASESTPFIATGGLAEVIGSLSKALAKDPEYDVRVVLPLYSDIKSEFRRKMSFLGNIFVPLSWRNQYCGIFSYCADGVTFYFLDNEYYFKRTGCYGYYDDGERFAFFSRSVMEILPFIDFYPDVLHCHDWQAAAAVLYLKTIYCFRPEYRFIRALFTIHNIEYQGKYSPDILEDLFGISNNYRYLLEYDHCLNLMKGAIECAEKFSTVSPTYAEEIKSAEYAHGLENIIRKNSFKLCGILNGIDTDSYNPAADISLFAHYDSHHLENKAICKSELQKMLSLPVKDVPVIAMISRLVSHKGLDLVKSVIEDVLKEDVQFVLLGTGDSLYENYFRDLGRRYTGKAACIIAFNGDLSRKIYSGADIFLMPSKSEPCGLSQMIAARYAAVPVVRETGGLFDSIKPYGAGGNGFTFAAYNANDMLYVVREAIHVYKNREEWKQLMEKAATTDFSWTHSAEQYKKLYADTVNGNK